MIEKLDVSVVKRIAAGEVIHHPRNAVKELVENSLDAGATSITILLLKGGQELIKIIDNGHGVKKEDMPLLCERYTTSKLKEYKDLSKLRTFGFRGEALASISQISTVTVVSKHKEHNLGYQTVYRNGVMQSNPRVHASNYGCTISVENLFNNIPIRKKTLKSSGEEYYCVLDCMKKYAIHNSHASFTLKKESSVELICPRASSKLERIEQLYGKNTSLCLKFVQYDDSTCNFHVFFNNTDAVTTSNKKFEFVLFVNNRLVDNTKLKKEIKEAYKIVGSNCKPYFAYIALNVNPSNIDVNVHPNKSEVHLLNEEQIINKISSVLKESIESSIYNKKKQKSSPGFLSQKETLNYYFKPINNNRRESTSSSSGSTVSSIKTPPPSSPVITHFESHPNDKFGREYRSKVGMEDYNVNSRVQEAIKKNKLVDSESSRSIQQHSSTGQKKRKSVYLEKLGYKQCISNLPQVSSDTLYCEESIKDFDSIVTIKNEIISFEDKHTSKLISGHQKIGTIDDVLYVVTYKNQHYLINYNVVSEEYFYQIIINNIGKFGMLMLSTNLSIQTCLSIVLPTATKDELNEYSNIIYLHNELLKAYYYLEVILSKDQETLYLVSLPMIILNYAPKLDRLPIFLHNLAKNIDWDNEVNCLDGLAHEFASLYCCCDKKQWEYVQPYLQRGSFKAPKILCDRGYLVELDFPESVMEK